MEVRQQGIDTPKRETRRDEERRASAQLSTSCNRLEHTHGGCTHGKYTASAGDPAPRIRVDLVPLAMENVLLQAGFRDGSEGIETHVERHVDGLEISERVRCEMKTCGWSRRRPQHSRVDGLVPLWIFEWLANVWRKGGVATRLAVESDEPASVAERFEELHRAEPLSRAQSACWASERFPRVPACDGFEEEDFHRPAGGASEAKPRGYDAAVVDHDELVGEEPSEIRENRVLDGGRVPSVHQEPRRIARLDGMLGNQLRGQLVVKLSRVHPARRVASAPMDSLALERAKQRIADAAAGRPEPAALEAALERSRSQIETLAVATAEFEASIPAQVGSAVRDGLRAEVLPVARHIAEIRGLLNQAIRRLERLEGQLLAERHARVDDLALLVDLVSSGWKGVDTRLERLERAQEEAAGSLIRVEATAMNEAHEQVEHAAAA